MKRFLKYATGFLLGLSLQNTPIGAFFANSILPKFLLQFLITNPYSKTIGLVAGIAGLGASYLVEEKSPNRSSITVILGLVAAGVISFTSLPPFVTYITAAALGSVSHVAMSNYFRAAVLGAGALFGMATDYSSDPNDASASVTRSCQHGIGKVYNWGHKVLEELDLVSPSI